MLYYTSYIVWGGQRKVLDNLPKGKRTGRIEKGQGETKAREKKIPSLPRDDDDVVARQARQEAEFGQSQA